MGIVSTSCAMPNFNAAELFDHAIKYYAARQVDVIRTSIEHTEDFWLNGISENGVIESIGLIK